MARCRMDWLEGNRRKGVAGRHLGTILARFAPPVFCFLVAALWILVPVPAQAQFLPMASQTPPMPEPIPCGPGAPGVMTPPPGLMGLPSPGPGAKDNPMELSCKGPSAFNTEDPPCALRAFYLNVGAMGLMRQRLGNPTLAVLDPQNLDTGNSPPRGAPGVFKFSDLDPKFTWGVRATLGYRVESCAVEFSGFYLSQTTSSKTVAQQGQLDLPFTNPPLGFEGDNGLWLQADRAQINLETALASAEANFRWAPNCFSGIEWLVGVRYVDLRVQLGVFTDDDGLTVVDINGNPDPLRQATLAVKTHNRIVGPQLGFEGEWGVLSWLSVGLTAKGAWGVNFVDIDRQLTRGDGFVGFATHRSETIFSHLYEVGLFADWGFNDHVRLRTGYNAMWLVHIADVQDQFDFDLSNTIGTNKKSGNIFFHGPQIELQFLF